VNALLAGDAFEEVGLVPARYRTARNFDSVARSLPTFERAVLGTREARERGDLRRAVGEGNRSLVLPDVNVEIGGRGYALSVKGAGAQVPLYGDLLEGDARAMSAESWLGEAPFGGQGEESAARALSITELANGASIHGFFVCPVIAIAELELGPQPHWYRRWRGKTVQEHRLVPSDVRLYHASSRSLARMPDDALELFELHDAPAFDAFVDRLLASGIAALTLFARTMREGPNGIEGLDLDDSWLDKDSVVARDGALHFVDLEGLDWRATPNVEAAIARQIDRNAYELLYAVDGLLRAAERRADRERTRAERRESVVQRIELALARDPFVSASRTSEGLDLIVRPALGAPHRVRFIDLEES
jgi:hypothetical protein